MYKSFIVLACLTFSRIQAAPVIVHPTAQDDVNSSTFIITSENTVNGTTPPANTHQLDSPTNALPLALINNFPGAGTINAYVTGTDGNGKLFMLQADGTNYYPTNPPAGSTPQIITAPVAIPLGPQGSTTNVNLASYISAGRIWFAVGELSFYVNNGQTGPSLVEPSPFNPSDPSAGVNWGFIELTWNSAEIYANISYVDFVGLVVGMMLTTISGATQTAKGLPAGAVTTLCNALKQQATSDGQPWDQLCAVDSNGDVLRVLSPNNALQNGNFGSYWTNYVDQVWTQYTNNDLTINSQDGNGNLIGRVNPSSGNLEFANGGSFVKPNAADIFGCNSGPFANAGVTTHLDIVSRLCAAFNRATLLQTSGNIQPDGITNYANFYTSSPANHYSRIVHSLELDGKGYAFPYDDVTPDGGADLSGAVSGSPSKLTLNVGGQ